MEFPPKVLRRVLFVAAPIVVFLSDFVSFRSVFENRQETQTVNLMSFVAAGKTRLGVYRAHQLYVSLDDVASPYFLADLAKARNALLVSAFKHEDGTISVAALAPYSRDFEASRNPTITGFWINGQASLMFAPVRS